MAAQCERRRWWREPAVIVALAVVLTGAAAQIRIWAVDRGLWHDELYVAYNLQHKGYLGLAGGLYWNQTAPPGWLIGEKAIYDVLGGSEYWLRLPALLASIAVLALTVVIAWQAVGRWAAPLAGALVAVSPMTLYYAGELKQYAFESCAALVIILCGAGFAPDRRRVLWFAAITTPMMAGTYSGVIVLGGVLAGLLLMHGLARQWRACAAAALAALPALAVGGAQVLLLKRFGDFLPDLDGEYFAGGMPRAGAGLGDIIAWLPRMWTAFVKTPLYAAVPMVLLLIALIGLAGLWIRGRRRWVFLNACVFGAAVGAAAVRGLPMVERVALYLVAPLMILLAAGVDTMVRAAIARRWIIPVTGAAVVLTGVAVAPMAGEGVRELRQPFIIAPYQSGDGDPAYDNGRVLLRQVARRFEPGDVVLSYVYTQPLVSWYAEQYGLPVAGYVDLQQNCEPGAILRAVGEARRVWYVRGVLLSHHPWDLHSNVLHELVSRGRVVDSWFYKPESMGESSPGWVLVDLGSGPDAEPLRSVGPLPGCLTVINPAQ